jgi:hypothetical protein
MIYTFIKVFKSESLRCAVLKILMYYLYIPVFARRAPCASSFKALAKGSNRNQ